jgi:hypothetical protein
MCRNTFHPVRDCSLICAVHIMLLYYLLSLPYCSLQVVNPDFVALEIDRIVMESKCDATNQRQRY